MLWKVQIQCVNWHWTSAMLMAKVCKRKTFIIWSEGAEKEEGHSGRMKGKKQPWDGGRTKRQRRRRLNVFKLIVETKLPAHGMQPRWFYYAINFVCQCFHTPLPVWLIPARSSPPSSQSTHLHPPSLHAIFSYSLSSFIYIFSSVLKWFIFCVTFLQLRINYGSQPSSHGSAPWRRQTRACVWVCVCVFYHCHFALCRGIIQKIRYTKNKYIMSEEQQTWVHTESNLARLPAAEFTRAHTELVPRLCSRPHHYTTQLWGNIRTVKSVMTRLKWFYIWTNRKLLSKHVSSVWPVDACRINKSSQLTSGMILKNQT